MWNSNFNTNLNQELNPEKYPWLNANKLPEPVLVPDYSVHINTICNGCNMNPLMGRRYKCLQCSNFDYCERCYLYNKKFHTHTFTIKVITKLHNANCDGCGIKNFSGTRFRCVTCYDFDFCQDCYNLNKNVHCHSFNQIR